MGTLRTLSEIIAEAIRLDPVVAGHGNVSVVVEDLADIHFQITKALGELGMCVTVAIAGFDRRSQSGALIIGTARIEIAVYECVPTNQAEPRNGVTAQGLAERIALSLHWRDAVGITTGPIRFQSFSRQDIDEANVVIMNFDAEVALRADTQKEEE